MDSDVEAKDNLLLRICARQICHAVLINRNRGTSEEMVDCTPKTAL